jgi:hypothetical protein
MTQDLHSPRLSDKVADALLAKMGIVDHSVNLAAAKVLRQHYDDDAIGHGLETYASNEADKALALASSKK